MNEQKVDERPRKRRGLKIFGIVVGILVVLLVIGYFVGTSEAFFKSVILPRVSKSMNADVTVEQASISPFSHVQLTNLKVVTTGTEPLLTAQEARIRYSLMKIARGNIAVQEAVISSPAINVIENADGSSNLDPLTKGKKEQTKNEPSKSSKPPQVDLQNFVLSNGTLRRTKFYKGGGKDTTEIANLNINLDNLQNGQSGKFQIGANLAVNNNPPAPGTNGALQAKLNGNLDFTLKNDLAPASLKGSTILSVDKASGSFTELNGLTANLTPDMTPTEIKQIALRFQKGGSNLGELRASGPFDSAKMEGRLFVEMLSIDRQVLNLLGASSGLDFGSATINSTNQIDFAKGGAEISAAGQLNIGKFSFKRADQATPALDLQTAYNLTVDRTGKSANIQTLTLNGAQNQKLLLRGQLTSPMKISWGDNAQQTGDSAFNLALTALNLAEWKPFAGKAAPAGLVNLNLKVASQQSGKQLTFESSSDMQGLTLMLGSNSLANLKVGLNAQGTIADLKKFDLRDYRLNVSQQNQPMLSVSGSGQYDQGAETLDMKVVVDGNLAPTFAALHQTNIVASSGKLGLNGRLLKAKETQTLTGKLSLSDFTGEYAKYPFNRFGAEVDLDVLAKTKHLQIRKAAGKVNSAGNPGGAFDVSGDYDTEKKAGQFEFKLADFNQHGLRPFLQSMIGEKSLVSVTVNSTASARLEGENAAVKANLQMANFVVSDLKKPTRETPLEAKFNLDASMEKKILELRQMQATLTATQKAKNEVQVTGRIDMSNSNAITGKLRLAADSLDVTRYYDIFAGNSEKDEKPDAPATGTTSAGGSSSAPKKEPEPKMLPMRNFMVAAEIGRFYLRELEIANLQSTIQVDQNRVTIEPFRMAINGAPVTSKVNLDLGVRGYKYDLSFTADKVPLEPLANTFAPKKRGMYKGILLSDLKVTGAGVTGASMKKTLAGQFSFNFTNANIQIVNKQLKSFLAPIAAFLGAPELLNSPINFVVTQGQIGGGKIALNDLLLASDAFVAQSRGDISIADDIKNSTFDHLPMHFSINRSLASKIRIAPKTTATNEAYLPLPDFIQVAGTLGAPKPKLDLNVQSIAGNLLEKFGGKIPGVSEKTGNLLEGVGGILGGKTDRLQGSGTNQPSVTSTNRPATNAPTRSNPLDLLDQFRKKK